MLYYFLIYLCELVPTWLRAVQMKRRARDETDMTFGTMTVGYILEQDSEYAVRSQRVRHGKFAETGFWLYSIIPRFHFVEFKQPNPSQSVSKDEGTVKVSGKHGTTQTLRLEWEDSSSDAYDPTTYEETLHSTDSSETLPAPAAYNPRTLMTLSRLNHHKLNYDLLVALLSHICFPSSSIIPSTNAIPSTGAVLVFLPGLAEIRRLHDLLLADRRFADPLQCIVYPLHSVLASEEQGRVFETPPKGCRKVVLATNVAETGITIPDVTVVLDAGRVRVVRSVRIVCIVMGQIDTFFYFQSSMSVLNVFNM